MFSHRETLSLLLPYVRKRLMEQVKAVFIVVAYMLSFQVFILGTPINDASEVVFGLGLVIVGLAFFMEGLILGLMPLGETLGLKLPRKAHLSMIMVFAFAMGMGATFAEPAIGILRAAGKDVTPWEAPLLFRLLNKDTHILVNFVSLGVGLAVSMGVLRFIYHFSLKPALYIGVSSILLMTAIASLDKELSAILGLAWDCGAVTTGPVTVPLVLSLGVGISRMTGSDRSETSGFGVVTLASLFPIGMVLALGFILNPSTPNTMTKKAFSDPKKKEAVMVLFKDEAHYQSYVGESSQKSLEAQTRGESHWRVLSQGVLGAMQAILPLCLGMILVLTLWVRERLTHGDEVGLGILFAVIGMSIFNIGIELGLANIGRQVGHVLPSAYKTIELDDERHISNFSEDMVYAASTAKGETKRFFYLEDGGQYLRVPYDRAKLDPIRQVYSFRTTRGPLFGDTKNRLGTIVILIFAFILGYGATLAEPALNALGNTVENLTAGSLRKTLLMHSVALGVGLGLTLGMVKIVWNVPIIFLLAIPYLILLVLTAISSESFVNIAWDSAGVTTGPITVPLVIAMGLGIGGQSGVVEGFGILAMASVCPILVVLCVGLWVQSKQISSVSSSPFKSVDHSSNDKQKKDKPQKTLAATESQDSSQKQQAMDESA
ncbi:DUF1538 domain-containing protein [Pseudobacteriovorax antillogorgiicola]|nr:DUF1538 domain-containing protein [Pseudobacteriovorax antillogorgiicola]